MGIKSAKASVGLMAAAGVMAVLGFGQQAKAASVDISGGSAVTVAIGTAQAQNNVLNNSVTGEGSYTSGLSGFTSTDFVSGATIESNLANYSVTWYFVGNESADSDTLTISSPTFTFTPGSKLTNENCSTCGASASVNGFNAIGTSSGSGTAPTPISFTFKDTNTSQSVSNGSSAIVAAYVTLTSSGWQYSSAATNYFVVGYNDNGSSDGDFDDLMFVGAITATPLPSTWILMLTALAGLGFLFYRRNAKNDTAVMAVAA